MVTMMDRSKHPKTPKTKKRVELSSILSVTSPEVKNLSLEADLSIFDMFKIGIGPSSSHTMGPWVAALDFIDYLKKTQVMSSVHSLQVELTGSLAKTGKGHATDMGVILGLLGEIPDRVEPASIEEKLADIKGKKRLEVSYLKDKFLIQFDPIKDIIFNYAKSLPHHPNGLIFRVLNQSNQIVCEETYYSIGGGFIEKERDFSGSGFDFKDSKKTKNKLRLDYPISSGVDILKWVQKSGKQMDEIVYLNEQTWRSSEEIDLFIRRITSTMLESIYIGCHTHGVLPGGLKVRRRAYDMCRKLIKKKNVKLSDPSKLGELTLKEREKMVKNWFQNVASNNQFVGVIDWVVCFALAVNETNASSGRIVTAPTNGAAGVIPAVLAYYLFLQKGKKPFSKIRTFLLIASIIGILFKKNATISAAQGGCQAEIGVSSAMAAGALTAVNGGNVKRILMAAEIAMEHHLGMTCDPIGGLVQIPCIERNGMGSIKAITASQIALSSDPDKAVVHIDDIIKTMWETAVDMNHKYKETAEGGLATNVSKKISVVFPEC